MLLLLTGGGFTLSVALLTLFDLLFSALPPIQQYPLILVALFVPVITVALSTRVRESTITLSRTLDNACTILRKLISSQETLLSEKNALSQQDIRTSCQRQQGNIIHYCGELRGRPAKTPLHGQEPWMDSVMLLARPHGSDINHQQAAQH